MPTTVRPGAKKAIKACLRPILQPWMRGDELTAGLLKMGIDGSRPVLVHSSLSSLGFVPGGVPTILTSLRDAIATKSILAMPTHSWALVSKGSRIFDARETPSCVGQITEVFRKQPHVRRSLHPTHSIAAEGPGADELVRNHERAETPCGPGTPYHSLLSQDAQVLFLGAPFESNTCYHAVEAMANVRYLMSEEQDAFQLVHEDKTKSSVSIRRHQRGIARELGQLKNELQRLGLLRLHNIKQTPCMVLDGHGFMNLLLGKLDRDQNYLLRRADNNSIPTAPSGSP